MNCNDYDNYNSNSSNGIIINLFEKIAMTYILHEFWYLNNLRSGKVLNFIFYGHWEPCILKIFSFIFLCHFTDTD